jgi:hypothetical protein
MRRFALLVVVAMLNRAAFAADLPPGVEPIVVGPKPMVVLPPPLKHRINWEPFILTGAGAAMIGIGIWRLFAAEADYQALRALTAPMPNETNDQFLTRARQLKQSGQLNTGLGWTLLGLGVASVGASLLWLFSEGLEKDPIVMVAPLPQGGVAVVEGRF